MDRRHLREIFTREYLRGPKGISLDQLNDPGFPEHVDGTVTEYIRIDPDGDLRLLGMDLDRLQVMWSFRDGIKSVQFEELVPIAAKEFGGYPYVGNRYIHAQWHIEDQCFRHLDGAVKIYDKQRYSARFDHDLRYRQPDIEADSYLKLFRLDGNLRLDFWAQLITRYFRNNELVIEYLGGVQEAGEDVRLSMVRERVTDRDCH